MTRADAADAENRVLGQRLGKLSEASLRISGSLDFDSVLQVVIDGACELTDARFGGITVNGDTGELEQFVSSGMTGAEHSALTEVRDGLTFFGHFGQLDEPVRTADFGAYCASAGLPEFGAPIPIRAVLAAPIRRDGANVGAVYLAKDTPGSQFSDEDQTTLVMFASHAALVIANARRHRDTQQARTDLETLIDTAPVGVLMFDARSGKAKRANPEALRIVRSLHSPDEAPSHLLEAMTVRRADGREVPLDRLPLAEALAAGETVRAEQIELARPDGRSLSVLVNATPIRSADGDLDSVLVTVQDLTPLEELDRMRADILGLVSEELRVPLVAVKGSAATLLESMAVLDPAEATELVRVIDAQADRMRDLIGELLDIARIHTGTLAVDSEPADLVRLVEEAAAAFADHSSGARVTAHIEPGLPLVTADRRRVARVLDAVLSEAAAAAGRSSPVHISAARDGSHVRVAVTPNGKHPAAQPLADLFGSHLPPLAGARTNGERGSALGLTVCKGIIEAHGGRIWARTDASGHGTAIAFTLPIAHSSVAAPATAAYDAARHSPDTARILVIDDDPQTRRYINDTLSKAGFVTALVRNAAEGIASAAASAPDLVLASVSPAGADGIELMDALRVHTAAPAVLVAEYGHQQAVLRAVEAGAADYVVKPFSPTELVARVRAALHPHASPDGTHPPEPLHVGDLAIDRDAATVTVADSPVRLTRTEYRLLCELAASPGRVLNNDQLLRRVWRTESPNAAGIVRSAIKRLRRKLGDDARNPAYIVTVPRMGYRIGKPER
ncbi:winged helix-turn-helix domain-containing protein [Candidatus Poriferisodalis sp.]|uniref:winged helix-turn-helix domain-containing protein n=1 Tax=Candidatus Poriferisodalis sp. TaxID=3101277 RepID=UPI003B02E15A